MVSEFFCCFIYLYLRVSSNSEFFCCFYLSISLCIFLVSFSLIKPLFYLQVNYIPDTDQHLANKGYWCRTMNKLRSLPGITTNIHQIRDLLSYCLNKEKFASIRIIDMMFMFEKKIKNINIILYYYWYSHPMSLCFRPRWRNCGDIDLNFVFVINFHPPNKSPNFKTMA